MQGEQAPPRRPAEEPGSRTDGWSPSTESGLYGLLRKKPWKRGFFYEAFCREYSDTLPGEGVVWYALVESFGGVPPIVRGDVVGAPHIGCLSPRHFTPEDADQAMQIDHVPIALPASFIPWTKHRS